MAKKSGVVPVVAVNPAGNGDDPSYHGWIEDIQARFLKNVGSGPVFMTDASDLWEQFLFELPADQVQYHTCNACKRFIEKFGGLVTIDEQGSTISAIWDWYDAPLLYGPSVMAMITSAQKAKVIGVFLSSDKVWGLPENRSPEGVWRHLAVTPPKEIVWASRKLTAGQRRAELREDYIMLSKALKDFDRNVVDTAARVLEADTLYRSEKVLGPATWLRDLHAKLDGEKNARLRENMKWLAVATAPAGFCHIRSSMIGTLLEDIAAGKSYEEVARAFKAKMHPLQYQRPTAGPSEGAIAAAEKLVEKLGIANSLKRRFLRHDELQGKIWSQDVVEEKAPSGGVFGHLKPKAPGIDMKIPPITMTWAKFTLNVLPNADKVEAFMPYNGAFIALLTASDVDAPPILQWDHEDWRNPVSCYHWYNGSAPHQWGLTAGSFVNVTDITLAPQHWGKGSYPHQNDFIFFALQGARETRQAGLALFPEILKAELREVRSVIEAYSNKGEIEGMDEPHVAGIVFTNKSPIHLRVTAKGVKQDYILDRMD